MEVEIIGDRMVFDKKELDYAKNIIGLEIISHETKFLQNKLRELKSREPTSDKPFFRLAIIGYELAKSFGSLEHAIVYAERFKTDPKLYNQEIKNAQLEVGQCLIQLIMLCQTYHLDVWKTMEIAVRNLEERHEDFKNKGWTEI